MPNLRVMLDECCWKLELHLQDTTKKLDIVKSDVCSSPTRRGDDVLIQGTKKLRRVLVTFDRNTIRPRDYPPCTHGGVLYIKCKSLVESDMAEVLKAFCAWRRKKHAVGHLTYLYENRAVIFTHKEQITVIWTRTNNHLKFKVFSVERKATDPIFV